MQFLNRMSKNHRTLLVAVGAIFLYSATLTFATTYVTPGTILDPAGLPGAYTVGPFLSYGGTVTSSHDGEVLYIDANGELASDSLFTRDSTNGDTVIAKSFGGNELGTLLLEQTKQNVQIAYSNTVTGERAQISTGGGPIALDASYEDGANILGDFTLENGGNTLLWDADTTDDIIDSIAQGQTLATIFKGNIIQHKNTTTGENASLIVADGSAGSLSPYIAGLSYTNATSPTLIIQSMIDASRFRTRYRDIPGHITSELTIESSGNTFSWDADTTDDIESIITQGENLAGAGIKGTGIMHSDTSTTSSATFAVGDVSSVFSISDFALYSQSTDATGSRHGEQYITSDIAYGVTTNYRDTAAGVLGSQVFNRSGNALTWDGDTSDDAITEIIQSDDLLGFGIKGNLISHQNTSTGEAAVLLIGDNSGIGGNFANIALSSADNADADTLANITMSHNDGISFIYDETINSNRVSRFNMVPEGVSLSFNSDITDSITDEIQLSTDINGFGLNGIGILHIDTTLGTLVSGLFAGDASALGLDTNISYISSGSILAAVNQDKFFAGDLLGMGNNTMMQVNDSNQKIKFNTGGQFIVVDGTDGEMFYINTATRLFQLGDIASGGNSVIFTVDDTNQLFTLSAANSSGSILAVTNSDGTCTLDPGDVAGLSCPSDENLKKDIVTLDSALDNILALRPVTYRLKTEDETANLSTGLIAQEVQQIFPTLVKTQRDNTLALNYGGLTPFMIKAIQELNLKITSVADLAIQNSFRDSLVSWFADTANGIGEFFAGRVRTNELCVGSVCVSESQFLQMVEQSGQSQGASFSAPVVSGDVTSDGSGDQTISENSTSSDTQETPEDNSDAAGNSENPSAPEPTESV